MKMIILVAVSLLSTNTFACPDFNGMFYKCTTGDVVMDVMMGVNKAKLIVTQTGKEISVDFLGKITTLKVDEIVEVENYSQSQQATIYSKIYSSCQNDILNIEEESKLVFDNGKVELESSQTDVFLKDNKIHLNILQHRDNGPDQKLNITCKRR